MGSRIDQVILILKTNVCAVCLSGERQFVHDPVLVNQVLFLCPKFFLKKNMQAENLCWECHKKLKNVWKFHKQVEDACKKLIHVAKRIVINGEKTCNLNSLSSLKTQVLKAQVDIAPFVDTFVKIENKIHEPLLSGTDDPTCIKMDSLKKIDTLNLKYENLKTGHVIQQLNNKQALIVNPPTKFCSATVTQAKSGIPLLLLKKIEEKKVKESNFPDINMQMRGLQVPVKVIASPLQSVKNIGQQSDKNSIHKPPDVVKPCQDKIDIRENKNAHDYEEILSITNINELESSDTNISFEDNNENLTPMENNFTDVDIPIMDFTNYGHIMDRFAKTVNIPIEDNTKDEIKINTKRKLNVLDTTEKKHIKIDRSATYYYKDTFRIFNETTARNITEEQLAKLRQDDGNDPSYLNANFKCDRCIFGFKAESQFNAHMEQHDECYGEEVCSVCELRFKHKEALDKHKESHFIAFFCWKCDFGSRFLQSVAAHYNQQHRPAVTGHYCDTCEAVFDSKKRLLSHAKIHSNWLTCQTCNISFKNLKTLRTHIRNIHKKNKAIKCSSLRVDDKSNYMFAAQNPDKIKCWICKKMISSRAMQIHQKLHNQQVDDTTYYCKECDKFFSSQIRYKQHLQVVKIHSTTRFECDYCGNQYTAKQSLADHIMTGHLGKEPVRCEQCGMSYACNRGLRKHVAKKHSRAAPPPKFICSQCGKAFTCMLNLSLHQLTHTGVRPYPCPYCDYKAALKGTLISHAKVKHKDRPPLKYRDIAPHNHT